MNSDEQKPASVGGSPVSIGDVLVLSDVESILSLDSDKRDSAIVTTTRSVAESAPATAIPTPTPDDVMLPLHPEFAYEDGNIELQTLDHRYWVHEFLIKKFSTLAEQIKDARQKGYMSKAGRLEIKASGHGTSIAAALRVLYAPVFPGPEAHKFNSETLIKALRIATFYGCPDIRKYAIAEVERRFTFLPIHRIQMSDEFDIPTWGKPALIELCRRPEPISKEEAKILGLDRLVEISRIRETEQRRGFIELVDKSVAPYGRLDQRDPAANERSRNDARHGLKYSSLPQCDCRVQRTHDDTQSNDPDRLVDSTALVPNNRHSMFGSLVRPQHFASHPETLSGLSLVPCRIHELAPLVVSENHTLLKQRNDLVKRLGDLKVTVSNQIPRGDRNNFSVEDEVNRATWVRKAA